MPRGQYDRSHLKAKRAAAKAAKAADTATTAAGIALSTKASTASPEKHGHNVVELYSHLASLVQARTALGSAQIEHNPAMLSNIDGEISGTVASMKIWRESTFPSLTDAKMPAEQAAPAKTRSAPLPAPITGAVPPPPAPLPFTPQAVQEVLKSAGQG